MASYSGLWNGVHSENYALQVGRSPLDRKIGRVLKKRSNTRVREAIDTVQASQSINGAAAVTYPRVQGTADPGNPGVQGGAVTVETVTQIAAASSTTAADVTKVDDIVAFENQPTYPVDLGGNGGGGKLSHVTG